MVFQWYFQSVGHYKIKCYHTLIAQRLSKVIIAAENRDIRLGRERGIKSLSEQGVRTGWADLENMSSSIHADTLSTYCTVFSRW